MPLFAAAAGASMDLRQCLILISGHLTRRSNPAALAESTVPFQMKISHSVARVNSLCRCENMGDCQCRGAGGGRPGERPFELSLICHVMVTVRETQVLLRTAALSGVSLPGAGSGPLRRWRTWAAMSTLRPGGGRRRSHRAPCAFSKRAALRSR